jgi:type I restriction enzyme S subunit
MTHETSSTLNQFLEFKNGKTSPSRKDDGNFTVFGSNGEIGRSNSANSQGPLIVIGRVGSYCGSLFYAESDAWVTDNAIICSSRDSRDVRYWYYALQTLNLNGRSSGSGQPLLNQGILGSIPFTPPEMPDRRGIAEVLGALDDKIAANTKLAATSSALAGLLYDREAAGVGNRPMSQVLTPVLGGTPSRSKREEFWDGSRLWASAKDITAADFGVVTDTAEKITDLAVATTKAKPLPSGSVVLTARGTVGAVARLAVPASFNQSCYGFVPGLIPAAVLYFAVLRATQRAKEIAHGSVFDTITMKTFDHLSFPDFDSSELAATEAILAPLMESVTATVVQNKALATTRDALLPQLMSGKLRVTDADKVLEGAGV